MRWREFGSRTSSASFTTTQRGLCRMTRAKARHCFSSSVNSRSHRSTVSRCGSRCSSPTSRKRLGDDRMVVSHRSARIGDDLAEGAGRDIGSHRHEHDRVARRVRDLAAPPGPKAANGAKQQGFLLAIFAGDQDAFAGVDVRVRFAQHDAARGRGDVKIVDLYRLIVPLGEIDAACRLAEIVHSHDRLSEPRHAQRASRASPRGWRNCRRTIEAPSAPG